MDFVSFRFILEWIAVISIFLFAIYAMLVIKNEKNDYIKNAIEKNFYGYKLFLPHWWGLIENENKNLLHFKRLDSKYEWESFFKYLPIESQQEDWKNLSIEEVLKSELESKKLLFDLDTTIITNPSEFSEKSKLDLTQFELCRVEGTATIDRQERVYYDSFIIRQKSNNEVLLCESISSILNGLVEGPYFEEVIQRIIYQK